MTKEWNMSSATARLCLLGITCFAAFGIVLAQSQPQKRRPAPTPEPSPARTQTPETAPDEPPAQDVDTLKIKTDLVTVPVIATDRNGIYAADLTKEEFNVWEDGSKQEIAFFATVSAPFHVVLMLDTSGSTKEKLGEIQRAAIAFVEQLQPHDKVKIIVFDDDVRDLSDFTGDRAVLRAAINRTRSGKSTKLYDAFEVALNSIRTIKGRKAIVLFSDGVDSFSDRATFDSTLRGLDEEGVIVYPIRYETREDTERLVRQQNEEVLGPQLPTIGVIRAPSSGTTAPTFPSDDPDSVPTSGTRSKTGPLGLPLPEEILRRRREQRDPDRYPQPGGLPPIGSDPTRRPDPRTDPGSTTRRPDRDNGDEIDAMLDREFLKADSYLKELERRSGGKLLRADTLGSLPDAFAKIAAELRTQYALGYYPSNKKRDGKYRKIKVNTTRKDVVTRSRPGYLASDTDL
jgi:von Willebrand factor type A domain